MDTVNHIISRSITRPFYRQHAGAFLFLFLVLFGIQPSLTDAMKFHYAIIQSILSATDFFLVALAIWLLYTLKTIHFFYQCLRQESYDFLFQLNATVATGRFARLLRMNAALLAPAGLYGAVIFAVSIKEHKPGAGMLVLLSLLVLYIMATAACFFLLKKEKAFQQVVSRKLFPFSIPPSLAGFILRFMMRRQFIALLIIKLLSFTILYYFVQSDTSLFENRMLWLIFITALAGHSFLVYRNFQFQERELDFYRNMPVRNSSTVLSLLLVYIILLAPEAWAMRGLAIIQLNTWDYVWIVLSGPPFLLLVHCLLYTEDMKMEEFLKLLFGIWIVFVLFSLSTLHWLIPVIGLAGAAFVFYGSYRKYEPGNS